MADIEFNCPKCYHLLAVEERGAGKQVNCPKCGSELTIPSPPSNGEIRPKSSHVVAFNEAPPTATDATEPTPQNNIACPKCRAVNPFDASFCKQCGTPLTSSAKKCCVGCGAKIDLDARFCINCGGIVQMQQSNLPPPPLPPPPVQPLAGGSSAVYVRVAKSRGIYIILGLFFGQFGLHNIYAGHYGAATVQLFLFFVVTAFFLAKGIEGGVIFAAILVLSILFDLFTTKKDSKDNLLD